MDTGGTLLLTWCSSEDDKHGCAVVGAGTVFRADTVAVLRSKSDGFQVYSRCVRILQLVASQHSYVTVTILDYTPQRLFAPTSP